MNAVWNGTPGEYLDFTCVLDRHCGCEFGVLGVRLTRCGAHDLTDDQRALNGLLYGRRLAATLRDEEWLTRRPAAAGRTASIPGERRK
ncbi:MAG: hypothetical protein E6I52_22235 [Chloroflexi bacterium]|nr:MAG: hypothetical protein E6I52_22235 [Chloroflexota bacterium]